MDFNLIAPALAIGAISGGLSAWASVKVMQSKIEGFEKTLAEVAADFKHTKNDMYGKISSKVDEKSCAKEHEKQEAQLAKLRTVKECDACLASINASCKHHSHIQDIAAIRVKDDIAAQRNLALERHEAVLTKVAELEARITNTETHLTGQLTEIIKLLRGDG